MGQGGSSRQEDSRQDGSPKNESLYKDHLIAIQESQEQLLTRFPPSHSCKYCQEEVINALNAKWSDHPTFLRSKADAIDAANDGCALYEWLLLFSFRSQAPSHHGFYLTFSQRWSRVDYQDIASVQFIIGTPKYNWPCASFEPSARLCPTRSFTCAPVACP